MDAIQELYLEGCLERVQSILPNGPSCVGISLTN